MSVLVGGEMACLYDRFISTYRVANRFSEGHIPGAHPFPLGHIARDIDNAASSLRALHERSSGSPIVLYCKSGYRSQLAQDEFVLAGLSGAVSLEGGWRAWEEHAKKA